MNLATKVTVARIMLIMPAAVLYILAFCLPLYQYGLLIAACVTFSLLCATDFIDGTIARKTHTVSNLGKFLDPLADKVIVVIMLFLMIWRAEETAGGLYPYASLVFAILSGLVVSRELIIGIFRTLAVQKKIVLAADVFGKIKTVFLDVAIAVSTCAAIRPLYAWAGQIFFYIGAALAIVSGLNYIFKNKIVFSEIKEDLDNLKATDSDEEYPPKFFEVLHFGVENGTLSQKDVQKKFKIGSITTQKIFDKIDSLGYMGDVTDVGVKINLDQNGYEELLIKLNSQGEK